MARLTYFFLLLALLLDSASHAQTAAAPAISTSRIYIVLKPTVAEPGAARDGFVQRMSALGAVNLQFVASANAARCDVPVGAQVAIASDPDVSGVLPLDPAPVPVAATAMASAPAPSAPQGQVFTTPPYVPQQQIGMPMGGGMSAGMALLTDMAGSLVVKLLSPSAACKVRIPGEAMTLPAAGGQGAFEVKASGNCAWQAVSTADWLQVRNEPNASGTVAITYTAGANPGGHRQAVVVLQPVAGLQQMKGHTVVVVRQ